MISFKLTAASQLCRLKNWNLTTSIFLPGKQTNKHLSEKASVKQICEARSEGVGKRTSSRDQSGVQQFCSRHSDSVCLVRCWAGCWTSYLSQEHCPLCRITRACTWNFEMLLLTQVRMKELGGAEVLSCLKHSCRPCMSSLGFVHKWPRFSVKSGLKHLAE